LSLAHLLAGGEVWSDELAPWELGDDAASSLQPFSRSLAVRPDSASLAGYCTKAPPVMLDEPKVIVPLPMVSSEAALPLVSLVVLVWPEDPDEDRPHAFDLRPLPPDGAWRSALTHRVPGLQVEPHPDGEGWFRCAGPEPVSVRVLDDAFAAAGDRLSGYHARPCRRPSFRGPPVCTPLKRQETIRGSLAHLLNGKILLERLGPAGLMSLVGKHLGSIQGVQVIPGGLAETREAILQAVADSSDASKPSA
jgi:hypothetical protein